MTRGIVGSQEAQGCATKTGIEQVLPKRIRPPPMGDDLDALKVERDENDQRKEPTTSEKVALAQAIAETVERKQGYRTDLATSAQNCAEVATERADEIAAAKAGLGSGKTLEAAQQIPEIPGIARSRPSTKPACSRY